MKSLLQLNFFIILAFFCLNNELKAMEAPEKVVPSQKEMKEWEIQRFSKIVFEAAKENDKKKLSFILNLLTKPAAIEIKKEVINARGPNGQTPLIVAARHNASDVIAILVVEGADINATTNSGGTALMYAALYGNEKAVKFLLLLSAQEAKIRVAEKKINIDAQNKKGVTALMYAAKGGHLAILKELIAAGADINKADNEGNTALIAAVNQNHKEVVAELLNQKNINIDAINKKGQNAARFAKNPEMIEMLHAARKNIKTGGLPDQPNLLAHILDLQQLAKLPLIQDIISLPKEQSEAALLLFQAIRNKNFKQAIEILDQKNINIKTLALMLPVAVFEGDISLVQKIVEKKVDLNLNHHNGQTALMLAIMKRKPAIVELLLQAGADTTLKDDLGKTALDYATAIESPFKEEIKALFKKYRSR